MTHPLTPATRADIDAAQSLYFVAREVCLLAENSVQVESARLADGDIIDSRFLDAADAACSRALLNLGHAATALRRARLAWTLALPLDHDYVVTSSLV